MSAWLVSKGHIDTLVQGLVVEGVISLDDATTTGRLLWRENMLSLKARYNDTVDNEALDAYRFEGIEAPLDPLALHKQASCYDYQSCEHAGWPASEAHRLIEALIAALGFSEDVHSDPAWSKAPWGVNHPSEIVA